MTDDSSSQRPAPEGERAQPQPEQPQPEQPQHGQPQYGQPAYGQPAYGQPQYGQPAYGQPAYGQPQYGQPVYGQPVYGQPQYGQADYGQPQYWGPPTGPDSQPVTGYPTTPGAQFPPAPRADSGDFADTALARPYVPIPTYGDNQPTYVPATQVYGGGSQPPYTGQPTYYGSPYQGPPPGYWGPPPVLPDPAAQRKRKHRVIAGSVASVVALALVITGVSVEISRHTGTSQQTALSTPNSQGNGSVTNPFSGGSGSTGSGSTGSGSTGSGSSGSGSSGSGSGGFGFGFGNSNGIGGTGSTSAATATAAQQVGIVDINTVLDYGSGKAAGTGMVLTSSGEVLTNNHVVNGSTSISVVVVSTGKTYTARVIGTDATDDIAVLQLQNAGGLKTANFGDSSKVAVGDSVTGVGNAGGVGGTPSAAAGKVTALNQSITASDSDGSNSEHLSGLIETDAQIQAGDSGGPLYAADNTVIGIDTAASSGGVTTTGYAIPIETALSIAKRIVNGEQSSTITQGYPAFLGVELEQGSTAAAISGVVSGSAAAKLGLAAGDTITAVGGTTITTATDLSTAIAKYKPGQQVSLSWTDSTGATHSGAATLGEGPVK